VESFVPTTRVVGLGNIVEGIKGSASSVPGLETDEATTSESPEQRQARIVGLTRMAIACARVDI
jgi:hypothetical protein